MGNTKWKTPKELFNNGKFSSGKYKSQECTDATNRNESQQSNVAGNGNKGNKKSDSPMSKQNNGKQKLEHFPAHLAAVQTMIQHHARRAPIRLTHSLCDIGLIENFARRKIALKEANEMNGSALKCKRKNKCNRDMWWDSTRWTKMGAKRKHGALDRPRVKQAIKA